MTIAIILTAILLLVGMVLRLSVPMFRWLYIPASVIAGFVGLLCVQLGGSLGEVGALFTSSADSWKSWPGLLIAVVFAGMLLERQPSSLGSSLRRAGREGLMVWVIVLGQTAVGLLVTWLLIQPNDPVPDAFGMLIETGFAGGHGTAAAMGQVFKADSIGLDSGLDLGVMMATVGLIYGIVSGVFWINVGVRRGWTLRTKTVTTAAESETSLGRAVVRSDILDPLLVQAIWLVSAFAIGMLLQWVVNSLAHWIAPPPELANITGPDQILAERAELAERTGVAAIIGSFPLFIYTLFGGLAVRRLLAAIGKADMIDTVAIGRLTSTAMDVLVVAAIASLNLTAVADRAGSIAILVVAAAVWTAICLVALSRWMLPQDHWFELGLINYGMSTGTTATGFVLLRMIDPDLESGAAEDYALAAPLSSPFVGGGMLTVGLPLVVLGQFSIGAVAIALSAIVVALAAIGCWIGHRAVR